MRWFYCGRLSRAGVLIMNQRGVSRITEDMCHTRVKNGRCPAKFKNNERCPIYKKEILNEQKIK